MITLRSLTGLKLTAAIGALGLVSGFGSGWWLGTSHVEGKWAKTDNAELLASQQATQKALRDFQDSQKAADQIAEALSATRSQNARLKDELDEAINQEPIVRTVVRTVPGDCPEVSCPVIDAGRHFRLWNAAIRGEPAEDPATQTDRGDGRVSRPETTP